MPITREQRPCTCATMLWRERRNGSPQWNRWRKRTDGLVATVGKIGRGTERRQCDPGACARVLEVRHANDASAKGSRGSVAANRRKPIAERRGLKLRIRSAQMDQPAVPMDERLTAFLAEAIEAVGLPVKRMPSGAGHDAMVMAARVPTAMLFLRSPGGISHHPDETVREEDVEAALACGGQISGAAGRGSRIESDRTRFSYSSHERGRTCIILDRRAAARNPTICCKLQTHLFARRCPAPREWSSSSTPRHNLGARFTQMTASSWPAVRFGPAPAQRFLLCPRRQARTQGRTERSTSCRPADCLSAARTREHTLRAPGIARAAVIEKTYEPLHGAAAPQIVVGDEDTREIRSADGRRRAARARAHARWRRPTTLL